MSIIDEQGQPVAYGWNDIAAHERWESSRRKLSLISDEEFARRFPEIVNPSPTSPAQPPLVELASSKP